MSNQEIQEFCRKHPDLEGVIRDYMALPDDAKERVIGYLEKLIVEREQAP